MFCDVVSGSCCSVADDDMIKINLSVKTTKELQFTMIRNTDENSNEGGPTVSSECTRQLESQRLGHLIDILNIPVESLKQGRNVS